MFGFKRKPQRRSTDAPREFRTVIGEGVVFTGEIKGGDDVQVNGRVEGSGRLDGLVFVAPGGHWKGDIDADMVTVEGHVEGDVHARTKLDLHPGARVSGDVRCTVITMAVGATCDGKIHMHAEGGVTRFEDRRAGAGKTGD